MNEHSPTPRAVVEAYLTAFATRDPARIGPFIDDNVEWTIAGPVDVLPFCGLHHGKAAMLDVTGRRIPAVLRVFEVLRESVVIDGDRMAAMTKVKARRAPDDRVISYRVAHFVEFRAGKVVRNVSLLDSFDAVEQVIGHSLHIHDGPSLADGDFVAV